MIRLFVAADLRPRTQIVLEPDQAHYLTRVMRLGSGDELFIFNGRDGEWRAEVTEVGKGRCTLCPLDLIRPQAAGLDLDLIIALVKRNRLETIVEKAAELGARRVCLALTERTNADHANLGRLRAIAVEAAEQTGRLDVPNILPPRRLVEIIDDWDPERRLMFCDETGGAPPAACALTQGSSGSWAVLIGPEGGFSAGEGNLIRSLPGAVAVSLGPRILRADTAAIAALALWQSHLGDWRGT